MTIDISALVTTALYLFSIIGFVYSAREILKNRNHYIMNYFALGISLYAMMFSAGLSVIRIFS